MNNNFEALIAKKMIQKELINELEKINLIDFVNASNIIKKLEEDINKLKKSNEKAVKNMVVKIPV